jgi:23S rRNA (adenine2030-N6)-methyltransferase
VNYRHAFHAGNYADVFKHALLVRLMRALQRKEKGFLYLDTHAGRGTYDLLSAPASVPAGKDRLPEWPEGIGRLWRAGKLPPILDDYVALVREFNRRMGATDAQLRFYPGSPWIAELVRRPQDRLMFWEQQPDQAGVLRDDFAGLRRTGVECGDGYGALRAALPPTEHRALVLIDPPYEDPGEFDAILAALREGLRRFPSGVYVVWHPVTERAPSETFRAALKALTRQPTVWAELAVTADPQVRMKGCGLLVINPPWGFAGEVDALLPLFAKLLAVDAGAQSRSGWLVPEQ